MYSHISKIFTYINNGLRNDSRNGLKMIGQERYCFCSKISMLYSSDDYCLREHAIKETQRMFSKYDFKKFHNNQTVYGGYYEISNCITDINVCGCKVHTESTVAVYVSLTWRYL